MRARVSRLVHNFITTKVAVILDSSREFRVSSSDLNHGRVKRSSILPSTETSVRRSVANRLLPRIPSVQLIFKPLHGRVNLSPGRADLSIPVPAFKTSNLLAHFLRAQSGLNLSWTLGIGGRNLRVRLL
jgi:hypothetical protein